ncbi:MAG: PD40 domain-containing protein, partial [Planctomycetes bacterium]|nr:PD40 domain-containing protein [Planctomycetota bacterium]
MHLTPRHFLFGAVLVPVFTVALAGGGQQPPPAAKPLPLETTRTVKFTTTEGTWISLDASPDGRTLVFDLLGDLHTLPLSGGAATRITEGPAFDAQPRYSPDGGTIVFVSDRSGSHNLWLADADGGHARALTTGDQVNWHGDFTSPEWIDAHTIVVARRDSAGLELVTYDIRSGKGLKATGSSAPSRMRHLGVSVGGDPRYWYLSGSAAASGGMGSWQVQRHDRDTGTTVALTNAVGGGVRPVVSPNGRYLVYASRRDAATALKLRDLESGLERWLVAEVQRDAQDRGSERDLMPGSSFTPDGAALITSYRGKIWRVTIPDGTPTEIPFTADVEQRLGPLTQFQYRLEDAPVRVRQIRDLRVSPDGRHLAFNALRHIWAIDRTGGTPRRLTSMDLGEYAPAWSPDGRFLAYVTWTDTEGGHVYRMRSDGTGQPERLTRRAGFYHNVSYTPDGDQLVFVRAPLAWRLQNATELSVRSRPSDVDLVRMPAAGGDVTRVSPLALVPVWTLQVPLPHFVRGSDRVHIHDGNDGLVSMRLDGTDRRVILKAKDGASPVHEMQRSPDGLRVLIRARQSLLFVATLPPAGGPPPALSLDKLSAAPCPVVRVARFGADFPTWSADGRTVHYGFGRTFFSHDLAAAEASPTYAPAQVDIALTVPRDRPEGTVVLRGARILTLKTTAKAPAQASASFDVIENGDIVITNNRIAAVGPGGGVRAPAGARVMDVSGTTIMPGLVDVNGLMRPSSGIHRSQAWEYLVNLSYGVTTVHAPETGNFEDVTYGDLVEAGQLIGPRLVHIGRWLSEQDELKSLDDARAVLQRYATQYQTRSIEEYVTENRRLRQWIAMAAREQQITLTAEAGGNLVHDLTLMLDGFGGLEHNMPIVPLYQDVVRLAAESGITYTPNLLVSYGAPQGEDYFYQRYDAHDDPKLGRFFPHEELDARTLRRPAFAREDQFIFRDVARQAARILAAGGRVALGAHGRLPGLGVHWELWALASGMSNADALRAATLMGADAIGLGQDLGS